MSDKMHKHEEAKLAFNDLLAFIHEGKPLDNVDDTLIKIERGLSQAEAIDEQFNHFKNEIRKIAKYLYGLTIPNDLIGCQKIISDLEKRLLMLNFGD